MATFPAIIMFVRHKEGPRPLGPAINSFWYLICNNILGYCERPEELEILISGLLLRMCGIYLSSIILAFAKNGARLELRSLFHSLFATLRFTGDRLKMVFKSIVGLFWGTHFQHVGKFVPKTVPQCTFTTISTRSPAQPQIVESGRAHFELLSHETFAKLNVGAIAFESISLLLPNLCLLHVLVIVL